MAGDDPMNGLLEVSAAASEAQHVETGEKTVVEELAASGPNKEKDASVEEQLKPALARPEEMPERPPSPMSINLPNDQQQQPEASTSTPKASPTTVTTPPPNPEATFSNQPSPTQSPDHRPLNVTDALSYLDHVKIQFQNQPDVYNHFLDIMKEFKSQQIDTPGVIKRVSHLFHGHPVLIQGFNTFLPAGYRIECSGDAKHITVTTPKGTTLQTTSTIITGRGKPTFQWSTIEPGESKPTEISIPPHTEAPEPAATAPRVHPQQQQAMEPAVAYVQKIKQRCDPEVYKQFLDILSRYHHAPETIDEEEVSRQIARLFKNAPDLRADFRIFMPEQQNFFDEMSMMDEHLHNGGIHDAKGKRRLDAVASSSGLPQKKRRKAGEREREKEREREQREMASRQSSRTKKAKADLSRYAATSSSAPDRHGRPAAVAVPMIQPTILSSRPPPPPNDPIHFFDRVKRELDSRDTYHEFLKVINLFTQGYIDVVTLVKESGNFLVGDGELMTQFKEILDWDDRKARESWSVEQQMNERGMQNGWSRPTIAVVGPNGITSDAKLGKVDLNVQYGSYRQLPEEEINVACSGRDEMCREVLNNEWVSHPSWGTEENGFVASKKNVYEEALHRSEEERHEYDFHIEAIARTIAVLEPINNKISVLNPDEKNTFKMKPNLSGAAKPIHHRVIKKIYGRDAGADVIQAMQDSPAFAIPVVLGRLKQKEEEWKRGQREWHKVWREVDSRNYTKSLDHQSIMFKAADKKALTAKTFLNQIEVAREEQMAKRASLIDPLFARTRPRHQLEFEISDTVVLQDSLKLVFSFLDRTQGQIGFAERKRIEGFFRTFVPLFFMLDPVAFNSTFAALSVRDAAGNGLESDMSDDAASDVEMASVASGTSNKSGRKKNGNAGGDLRKKLLAKSTNRRTRAQEAASPSISRLASPVPSPDEEAKIDSIGTNATRRGPRKNIFFTNTHFYVLLRLIEVLYSRLSLLKGVAQRVAEEQTPVNPIANSLGLLQPNGPANGHKLSGSHVYDLMLESCERLFDNEIEQGAFEDQMRHMFGIKEAYKLFTIDKLIGVIIKQVQLIFSDPKSQDLLEIIKRDRALPSFTTQDQINSRRNAEKILGPDENIFRIDWLPDLKTMTAQLIGKDDSRFENSEVLTGRWQAYIDSFVSEDTSIGVPAVKTKPPFLRRNLPRPPPGSEAPTLPIVLAQDKLEIKICVRTYRLFFVSGTEDYLFTIQDPEALEKCREHLKERERLREGWVDDTRTARSSGTVS